MKILRVWIPFALTSFPLLVGGFSGICLTYVAGSAYSLIKTFPNLSVLSKRISFPKISNHYGCERRPRSLRCKFGASTENLVGNKVCETAKLEPRLETLNMDDWIPLSVSPSELRCDATLVCGQSFRWRKTADDEWTGVISEKLVCECICCVVQTSPHFPVCRYPSSRQNPTCYSRSYAHHLVKILPWELLILSEAILLLKPSWRLSLNSGALLMRSVSNWRPSFLGCGYLACSKIHFEQLSLYLQES